MLFNFRNLFKKVTEPSAARTTFFRAFEPLHLLLTDRSPHYRNWHATPYVAIVHTAVMVTSIVVTIAIMLALVFSSPRVVQSASLTWDGGGSTNNWSECANWTTDTCPTSADTVTFSSTSTKDSVVDASFGGVVTYLNIASGYTGTVTLQRSLQTTSASNAFTLANAAATFTAGSHTLDVDGIFTLSAGTFNASSGTTYLGGTVTISGGTFNHNSGTVEIDNATSVTLSCNDVTFNLVRFTASNNQKTINTGCTMPLGADPSLAFNIRLNGGTLSGSGTIAFTAQFNYSSGTLSGFSGITVASTLTVSGATLDLSNYNPRTITSTTTVSSGTLTVPNDYTFTSGFTLNGGTFNAPAGTVTFNSTFTASSGTFNHNNGTVAFGGTTTATLSCTVASFNQVAFTHTNNTKSVSSNCTMPLGADPTTTGAIGLTGTLSGTGTANFSSTLQMNAGAALSGFSGLVVTGTFVNAGATFDMSSYTTADFNGAFNLTSGTFTAPTGTMNLAGGFTPTAGTFNHNNGTVVLDGASGTINCASVNFNLVQFNHTSTKTISSGCTLPLGADPLIPTSITLAGTLSGTGTLSLTTNTITMNSGGSLSGFTGFTGVGAANLTIAGATMDASSFTTFNVSTFTISSGSFTAPAAGMTVRVNFVGSGGTFTGNGSTMTMSSNGNLTCSGATVNFSQVTFDHTTGTRTISGCTVPLGTNPSMYQTTWTNATAAGTGTLTITGAMTMNSGSALSGFTGFVGSNNFVLSGGTADFSNYSSVDFNNTLTFSSGTLTAPSTGSMTFASTFTITGGTFNHNSGTVTYDGATSATLTCNNVSFNKVVFAHTGNAKTVSSDCSMPLGENPTIGSTLTLNGTLTGSGTLTTTTGTLTLNSGSSISGFSGLVSGSHLTINGATTDLGSMSAVDINGNFTLSSGSFTAPSGTMTVSGNWTYSGGTFNHNNGTVELDGTNQQVTGANTFYNFKKTVTNRYTLTLPANTTQTILGAITLHGVGGKNLLLRSNTTGSQFSIDPRGSRDISFMDLRDARNVNGTRINIAGTSSFNASNNTGWSFAAPGVTNLGSTGLRDGSYSKTTQPVFSFDTSDQDASDGDTIKYQIQIDDSSDYGSPIVDYTSKLDIPGSYTYTVGQATGDGAYTTGSEGQKLSDGTYYWRIRAIDASGATSAYTNGKDNAVAFGVDTTAPNAPGVPKTTSATDDATPTWTWSAATDNGIGLASTDTYTFEWCNNSRFEGCTTSTKTTATTFTNGSLDVTTWYARVKAKDKLDQESSWSEVGIFNLNTSGSTGSSSSSQGDEAESEATTTSSEGETKKVASVPVKVVGSDGQPLAGAKAVLYSTPRTATTDANGIAIFTDVEVGEHRLVIAYKDKIGFQRIVVEADGTTSSPTSGASVDTPGQELTVEIQDSQPLIPSIALLAFRIVAAILIVLMYLLHLRRHHDFAYLGKSNDKGLL